MTAAWDAGGSTHHPGCRPRLDYQAAHGEDPVYTTVATVVAILMHKGQLRRHRDAANLRASWYTTAVTREDYFADMIGPSVVLRLRPGGAPAACWGDGSHPARCPDCRNQPN